MKRFLLSSSVASSASSSESPQSKRPKASQSFLKKYHEEWACLTSSQKGPEFAFCTICRCDFNLAHGGRDDCRRHVGSKKHGEYSKLEKERPQSLSNFFPSSKDALALKTTKAEAALVDLIVKKNLPVAIADDFTKFINLNFPDSEIAKKFACGRTKTSAITHHLADNVKARLLRRMKDHAFTISTDGSNDAHSKLYPIVVRSFDEEAGEVRSDVLSVPDCKDSATGRNIFELLNQELTPCGIAWSNCLGLGSDNANVMTGSKGGVIAFMKEKHPAACLMGCVCHLIHIAAEKGAGALPFNVDDKLVDIWYYLNKSSKRLSNRHPAATDV